MVNKQASCSNLLRPVRSLLLVSSKGTIEIPPESITPQRTGEKAFGLSCLPTLWTLPFVVVSDELLNLYKCYSDADRAQLVELWGSYVSIAAESVGIANDDQIIVRSSGCSEGMEDRGKFCSVEGSMKRIFQPMSECLKKIVNDADLSKLKIPLVKSKSTLFQSQGRVICRMNGVFTRKIEIGLEDLRNLLKIIYHAHLK